MKKQELIERIEGEKFIKNNSDFEVGYNLASNTILGYIKQLYEPEKVKVSEEEAKFLKTFDFNCESDVTTALYHVSRTGLGYYLTDNDGIELKDLTEGFRDIENRKRLIKAILDGYTIKKDKRYRVEMKGVSSLFRHLKYNLLTEKWYMGNDAEDKNVKKTHTRKEIEDAGFGWVFDCEGIEIEEVTE